MKLIAVKMNPKSRNFEERLKAIAYFADPEKLQELIAKEIDLPEAAIYWTKIQMLAYLYGGESVQEKMRKDPSYLEDL